MTDEQKNKIVTLEGLQTYHTELTNNTIPGLIPVSSVAGKTGNITLTNSDVGLGNVGNFKAVSTTANQELSNTEKSNARENIGAGVGQITEITMNGSSMGSSGTVDLGTVITSHQDISGKADVATTLAGYGIRDSYTKEEVNQLVTTPNVGYVTVNATSQTIDVTEVLPSTGTPDTIYRVGNWGGSQYDTTTFSEYAWNGTAFVLLAVHSSRIGLPIVLQSESNVVIEPNKINRWSSPISTLNVTFSGNTAGYANEYIIDFICPSNAGTTLTLPSYVIWVNDDELIPEAGMRYQISILDGLAIYAGWEAQNNA